MAILGCISGIYLHWLPLHCRVPYKILLTVFKCLHIVWLPDTSANFSKLDNETHCVNQMLCCYANLMPIEVMESRHLGLLHHDFGMFYPQKFVLLLYWVLSRPLSKHTCLNYTLIENMHIW